MTMRSEKILRIKMFINDARNFLRKGVEEFEEGLKTNDQYKIREILSKRSCVSITTRIIGSNGLVRSFYIFTGSLEKICFNNKFLSHDQHSCL